LSDDLAPLVRIRTRQCREFFGTRFGRLPPATVTTTKTGLLVTEVEAPEVISGLSDPKGSQRQLGEVLQYLQDFRVEVGKAKLVRKTKR
jgi:hypothetical protein